MIEPLTHSATPSGRDTPAQPLPPSPATNTVPPSAHVPAAQPGPPGLLPMTSASSYPTPEFGERQPSQAASVEGQSNPEATRNFAAAIYKRFFVVDEGWPGQIPPWKVVVFRINTLIEWSVPLWPDDFLDNPQPAQEIMHPLPPFTPAAGTSHSAPDPQVSQARPMSLPTLAPRPLVPPPTAGPSPTAAETLATAPARKPKAPRRRRTPPAGAPRPKASPKQRAKKKTANKGPKPATIKEEPDQAGPSTISNANHSGNASNAVQDAKPTIDETATVTVKQEFMEL